MKYIVAKYKKAGIIAAKITKEYDDSRNSAIINAAAPIIGGVICPPEDAQASTAAANLGR